MLPLRHGLSSVLSGSLVHADLAHYDPCVITNAVISPSPRNALELLCRSGVSAVELWGVTYELVFFQVLLVLLFAVFMFESFECWAVKGVRLDSLDTGLPTTDFFSYDTAVLRPGPRPHSHSTRNQITQAQNPRSCASSLLTRSSAKLPARQRGQLQRFQAGLDGILAGLF